MTIYNASDFGFSIAGQLPAGDAVQSIEAYRGWKIYRDETGFYAENGVARNAGYCDTLEEIRADVDWDIDREEDSELFRRGL